MKRFCLWCLWLVVVAGLIALHSLARGGEPANAHDYATRYQAAVERSEPLVIVVGCPRYCTACAIWQGELTAAGIDFAHLDIEKPSELQLAIAAGYPRRSPIPYTLVMRRAGGEWFAYRITGRYPLDKFRAELRKLSELNSK